MSDIDHAAVYRGVRVRVAALVCELPEETLDVIAPATPEWRVRDVVAHLAGATADIVSGNLADVASDEWTGAQVDARRGIPIGEVLDEWARCSAIVEPMIAKFDPLMRAMLLTDAVTHEHDVRGALGVPGERDSDAIAYAFRGIAGGIGSQRGDTGALRITRSILEVLETDDAGFSRADALDVVAGLHFLFSGWLLRRGPIVDSRGIDGKPLTAATLERTTRRLLAGAAAELQQRASKPR